MNFQNLNDLVPRPSPKPSQIEVPVVSSGPEVPEVSLLFDQNVRKIEPARMQSCKDSADRVIPSHSLCRNERPLTGKREQSNFCCGSNCESNHVNEYANPKSTNFNYVRNNPSINVDYGNKNGTLANTQCSHFFAFPKQCVNNYHDTTNINQSYVTLDEYQKMVTQFTNMILKLNYKFNQVLDSSISHEELNQITRKFELQIANLTQHINELDSKLEKVNNESVSRSSPERICCHRNNETVFHRVTERKCSRAPVGSFEVECNDSHQIPVQSPKQLYSQSRAQQKPDYEYKNPRVVDADDVNTDQAARDSPNSRESLESSPMVENDDLKRTKRNVELLQQNDLPRQCYSNHDHVLPSNNVIVSSDLSLLMNTLAMKYIPEGKCDPTKQDGVSEHDNMIIRNTSNYNNISMATLQYMERYQLLSSGDRNSTKSHSVNKTRSLSSQQPNCQEAFESNDRSFVR